MDTIQGFEPEGCNSLVSALSQRRSPVARGRRPLFMPHSVSQAMPQHLQHPLLQSMDHALASLIFPLPSAHSLSMGAPHHMCSHLLGSLTSKNRGGYTSALWILNDAFLALGTRSPEIALFRSGSMTYSDSKTLVDLDTEVTCMETAKTRTFFFVGDALGSVQFCSSTTERLGSIAGMTGTAISSLSSSICDQKLSIAGAHGYSVKIWDISTLREEASLQMSGYEPYLCDWHSSWSLVASGSRSQHVNLHDPRSPTPSHHWIAHRASLSALNWLPNREFLLVSAGREGVCRIWDIRKISTSSSVLEDDSVDVSTEHEKGLAGFSLSSTTAGEVNASINYATAIAFHPTIKDVITIGSSVGSVTHWSLAKLIASAKRNPKMSQVVSEDTRAECSIEGAHAYSVTSLRYNTRGDRLVSTGNDTACRVYGTPPCGTVSGRKCSINADVLGDEALTTLMQRGESLTGIQKTHANEGDQLSTFSKMPILCEWSA
eukprot:GHVH01010132.1.p1 GENE.GHVH01010132.1~~GHVH01010132.1.p1  ORF type:complete len:489 (-),score=55.88 GHVH01010132.1:790-2256(-)